MWKWCLHFVWGWKPQSDHRKNRNRPNSMNNTVVKTIPLLCVSIPGLRASWTSYVMVYGMFHLNRRCHWCIPKVATVFSGIIVPGFSKSWINIFHNNNNIIIIIMTIIIPWLSESCINIFLDNACWKLSNQMFKRTTLLYHSFDLQ